MRERGKRQQGGTLNCWHSACSCWASACWCYWWLSSCVSSTRVLSRAPCKRECLMPSDSTGRNKHLAIMHTSGWYWLFSTTSVIRALNLFLQGRNLKLAHTNECLCNTGIHTVQHTLQDCSIYTELRCETWRREVDFLYKLWGPASELLKNTAFLC